VYLSSSIVINDGSSMEVPRGVPFSCNFATMHCHQFISK